MQNESRPRLGVAPGQEHARAHSANFDPASRRVLVPDLGQDLVHSYNVTPAGLVAAAPPFTSAPGAGPRHLAWHPSGRWCFVINERGASIDALAYDAASGGLQLVNAVSTLPRGAGANVGSCAHVLCSADGRHVYGSNRGAAGLPGSDSIVLCGVDQESGALSVRAHHATGGVSPRHFAIHPNGRWMLVANAVTGNVVVFEIDSSGDEAEAGRLHSTGQEVHGLPSAMCLVFVEAAPPAAAAL